MPYSRRSKRSAMRSSSRFCSSSKIWCIRHPPALASRFRGVREATTVMEFASVPAMLRSAQRGGVDLRIGIQRGSRYRGADRACFGDHLDDAALQGRPQQHCMLIR